MTRKQQVKEIKSHLSEYSSKQLELFNLFSLHYDKNGNFNSTEFKTVNELIIEACRISDLSSRQIKRKLKSYKTTINNNEKLNEFIYHNNHFKEPVNKKYHLLNETVLESFYNKLTFNKVKDYKGNDYLIPYTIRDFFAIHCCKFNCSYSTVYKILRMNNINSMFASRKVKRICSKQLSTKLQQYNLNEELIKLLTVNNEYNHKKHQKSQKTLKPFGYEVEVDGCIHLWIPELGVIT